MDIIDENKYNEIKNILFGCRNSNDAKYFIKLYLKKNPEPKNLAHNLFYSKIYNDSNDLVTFHEIMEKINECDNYEFCMKLINEFYPNKNNGGVQLKTLLKLMSKKNFPINTQDKNTNQIHIFNNQHKKNKKDKKNEFAKECPHCSMTYFGSENLTHVICGYTDNHQGYDWKGCTKDWCFSCGKKLCKSWNDDKLYLEPNRIHNSECCKKYAADNFESYENYCQCNNKYIKRDK
jgi:hypothetical protein